MKDSSKSKPHAEGTLSDERREGIRTHPPARATASVGPASPAWQQLASLGGRPTSSAPPPPNPQASPQPPARAPRETSVTESWRPIAFTATQHKVQYAEKLCDRGNYSRAQELIDEAIAEDANNAAYHALRAWVLLMRCPPNDEVMLRHALIATDRALALDSTDARANYTRAMLFKRDGQHQAALPFFMRTVRSDPRHIDAMREIRLANMRTKRG